MRWNVVACIAALLLSSCAEAPQGPPVPRVVQETKVPELKGPVNDEAGILSDADEAQLRTLLLEQEKETGNQIVILTVPKLEGHDIKSYANKVFNTWKLGDAKKDNGVLIVQSTGDRKIRIEVGAGLEGVLPDAATKRIIDNEMVPKFKKNDFAGGYKAGVVKVRDKIKPPPAPPVQPNQPVVADGGGGGNVFMFILLIGFPVVGLISLLLYLCTRQVSPKNVVTRTIESTEVPRIESTDVPFRADPMIVVGSKLPSSSSSRSRRSSSKKSKSSDSGSSRSSDADTGGSISYGGDSGGYSGGGGESFGGGADSSY